MFAPSIDSAGAEPWCCLDAPVPKGHCWYFAYGSNMSVEQLRLRVGEPCRQTLAIIPFWSMAITKPSKQESLGYANIFPHPDPIQILHHQLQQREEMARQRVGVADGSLHVSLSTAETTAPITSATTTTPTSTHSASSDAFGGGDQAKHGVAPPIAPFPLVQRVITCIDNSLDAADDVRRMNSSGGSGRNTPSSSSQTGACGSKIANALTMPNNNRIIPNIDDDGDPVMPSSGSILPQRDETVSDTPLLLSTFELRRRGIFPRVDNTTATSATATTSDRRIAVTELPCDVDGLPPLADCPPYVVCTAYLLNEEQLKMMDVFEGAPEHYRRVELTALGIQLPRSWLEVPDVMSISFGGATPEASMADTVPISCGSLSSNPVAAGEMGSLSSGGGVSRSAETLGEISSLDLTVQVVREFGSVEPRPLNDGSSILIRMTGMAYIFGCVSAAATPSAFAASNNHNGAIGTPLFGASRPLVSSSIESASTTSSTQCVGGPLGTFAGLGSPLSSGTGRIVARGAGDGGASMGATSSSRAVTVLTLLAHPEHFEPPVETLLHPELLATLSRERIALPVPLMPRVKRASARGHDQHATNGGMGSRPQFTSSGAGAAPLAEPILAVGVGSLLEPSAGYLGRIRECRSPIFNHIHLIDSSYRNSLEYRPGACALRELLVRYMEYVESLRPSDIPSPRNQLREAGKI